MLHKATRPLPRLMVILGVYMFFTPTTSEDAVIFVMQAMPFLQVLEESILVSNRSWTAFKKVFNAVVETNVHARHLYERLGFRQLGTIPGGFRMKDGHYENICPYYHEL